MTKSAADLWAADPLFMGAIAAWPLAGQCPSPQICELAILDRNGAILFDTIIRPTPIFGAELQTRLIPAEHVMTAPTIDTLWDNLRAITNRRDVVMFNERLIRVLLKASATPYHLPPLPGYAHSIQDLYLDRFATAFTATDSPTLSHIALDCDLDHMTVAISQNPDQPWRIHHAVNEAETCRRILKHLASLERSGPHFGIKGANAGRALRRALACAQAKDEGQPRFPFFPGRKAAGIRAAPDEGQQGGLHEK